MRIQASPRPTRGNASPAAQRPKSATGRQRTVSGPADSGRAIEQATCQGHHFGRVRVMAPPARPPTRGLTGSRPIQAAGLFRAYTRLKGGVEKAGDAIGGGYRKVTGAVKGTGLYKGAAGLARGVGERKEDLMDRIQSSGLYGDARKISKDSGFRKMRAAMGVLGLAGGQSGPEARGAFRDRWDKHFASLPPKQRAAEQETFALPDLDAEKAEEMAQLRRRAERHRRVLARRRRRAGKPEELEMQEMGAPQPPNRFGDTNDPFDN